MGSKIEGASGSEPQLEATPVMMEPGPESADDHCSDSSEDDDQRATQADLQRERLLGEYDLTCAEYLRKKLGNFILVLAWGLVSACCWAGGFWCTGQLRYRAASHQLLFTASAPLLLAAGTGLLMRHFQHGNVASAIRYHWRPILCSGCLLCASFQLAFRAAQRLPVAADAVCILYSYAGIMSLPLCFVLQIYCTKYGMLAAAITVVNLGLLTRPTFLPVVAAGAANATDTSPFPPTPPADFAGCAVAAVLMAVAVTVAYWKLSGVSALPLLALTSALLCASSVGLQLFTVAQPLRPPQLKPADAPLAVGAVCSFACGLPVLLHWLRSERSRLFQLVASSAASATHLLGYLAAGQQPDLISLAAAGLMQVATALVTLGQMRHESWLQYREDSRCKYSRLTILPDTPFHASDAAAVAAATTAGAGVSQIVNGSAMAETSFNSVTVRRQSDSANHHNGDAFFQEVCLADDRVCEGGGGSIEGGGVDGGGDWKPLKLG